jgi:hypothetical protein
VGKSAPPWIGRQTTVQRGCALLSYPNLAVDDPPSNSAAVH